MLEKMDETGNEADNISVDLTDEVSNYAFLLYKENKLKGIKISWVKIIEEALLKVKEKYPKKNIICRNTTVERNVRKIYAKEKGEILKPPDLGPSSNSIIDVDIYKSKVKKFRILLNPEIWNKATIQNFHNVFHEILDIIAAMSIFIPRKFRKSLIDGVIIPPVFSKKFNQPKDKNYVVFTWKELKEMYCFVQGNTRLNRKQLIALQKNLFRTFLSSAVVYDTLKSETGLEQKIVSTFCQIFPGAEIVTVMNVPLTKEHILGNLPFDDDSNIKGDITFNVVFPIYNMVKLGDTKVFKEKGSFFRDIVINVKAKTKEVLSLEGWSELILNPSQKQLTIFVDRIYCLEITFISACLGARSFVFQSMWLSLENFCRYADLKTYYEESRFRIIKDYLFRFDAFFRLCNFARFCFDEDLGKKSLVFIEFNPEAFKNSFDIDATLNTDWVKKRSIMSIAQRVYNITNQQMYSKLKNTATIDIVKGNVVSVGLDMLSDAEREELYFKDEKYLSNNGVIFDRLSVYSVETEVILSKKIGKIEFLKMDSLIANFYQAISKSLSFYYQNNLLLSSKILFSNVLDGNFVNSLEGVLAFLLRNINVYFDSINAILKECVGEEVNNFFNLKFENEKMFLSSDRKLFGKVFKYKNNWFTKDYSFKTLFPSLYRFSLCKEIKTKKNDAGNKVQVENSTLIINSTRLEELKLSHSKELDPNEKPNCSIMSMPQSFRRSFQANVAHQLSDSVSLRAVNISIINLKSGVALLILRQFTQLTNNQLKEINSVAIWNQILIDIEFYLIDRNKSNVQNYVPGDLERKFKLTSEVLRNYFLSCLCENTLDDSLSEFNEFKFIFSSKNLEDPYFLNIKMALEKFFQADCAFFQKIRLAYKGVLNLKNFMGAPFPGFFSVKDKLTAIFRTIESISVISFMADVLEHKLILHSIENNGITVFGNDEILSELNFSNFNNINKNLFDKRLSLSLKLLVKAGSFGLAIGDISDKDRNILLDAVSNGQISPSFTKFKKIIKTDTIPEEGIDIVDISENEDEDIQTEKIIESQDEVDIEKFRAHDIDYENDRYRNANDDEPNYCNLPSCETSQMTAPSIEIIQGSRYLMRWILVNKDGVKLWTKYLASEKTMYDPIVNAQVWVPQDYMFYESFRRVLKDGRRYSETKKTLPRLSICADADNLNGTKIKDFEKAIIEAPKQPYEVGTSLDTNARTLVNFMDVKFSDGTSVQYLQLSNYPSHAGDANRLTWVKFDYFYSAVKKGDLTDPLFEWYNSHYKIP